MSRATKVSSNLKFNDDSSESSEGSRLNHGSKNLSRGGKSSNNEKNHAMHANAFESIYEFECNSRAAKVCFETRMRIDNSYRKSVAVDNTHPQARNVSSL